MEKPSIFDKKIEKYLVEFERYNQMMEVALIKEFNLAKVKWDSDDSVSNYDQNCNIYEHVSFYPLTFRNSLLVQIFSVYEIELKNICLYHHFVNKTNFSIRDLKGNSDIDKAKMYLQKSCQIDLKILSPELDFLDFIRKLRNLIVHSQGQISQSHKDFNLFFNFIKSNNNLLSFMNIYGNLDKEKINQLYDYEDNIYLEIQDFEMINKLILTLRIFFKKLINEIII